MGNEDDILIGSGRWTLPALNLLFTSDGRNWSGIAAELRRHVPGEVPEMISDRTVVAYAAVGSPRAMIHRCGNGLRQATPARTGTFWLCPEGVSEDGIRITGHIPKMLHIYLPRQPFRVLSQEDGFPDLDATTVGYNTGAHDRWIATVGQTIVTELMAETASGRLLVETAGLALSAALAHSQSSASSPLPRATAHALDARRLHHVFDFIEAHLTEEFGVDDLAAVACLSRFHFMRAFKAATGVPPHRFVSERRLEHAKWIIENGDTSLSELALVCRFSSQANFSRAFRRVVGMSPGAYRRSVR